MNPDIPSPDTSAPGTENGLDFEPTLKGLQAGQKVFAHRYTLLRILGRGGMGVVWLARDEELNREVALKFLPEFVALDKAALTELKEETNRTLDLTHDHILRTYTFHSDQELAAIAMEYVEGQNLSEMRVEQSNKVFEATDAAFQNWVGELCGALAYAHAKKKVVHRDLKPSNIMVNAQGEAKVADFGIARSLSESMTRLSRDSSVGFSGTLPYMSPQQALGQPATESDDIYSLGATLYELLTGKPPFYAGEVYEQIRTKEATPITTRRQELNVTSPEPVPDFWEKVILACLAKNPADRPQSVAELAQMLGVAEGLPVSKPRQASFKPTQAKRRKKSGGGGFFKVAAIILILLAGGAGAAWWFLDGQQRFRASNALVEKASEALEQGDYANAGVYVANALESNPTNGEARTLRERIEAHINDSLERELALAETALAKRDLFAAKEAYAKILGLEPNHPRAQTGLEQLNEVVGGVEVKTSPQGAKIEIGGLKQTMSPASLEKIPLGKHRIKVTLTGYEPIEDEVILRSDSFISFDRKLVRERGILTIESIPNNMDVEVRCLKSMAGKEEDLAYRKAETTPVSLDNLPTGTYEITFRKPGWPDAPVTTRVIANSTETVSHIFGVGSVQLVSELKGVQIYEQEKLLGTVPLDLADVPSGKHIYEARYQDWPPRQFPVEIAAGGESQTVDVHWPKGILKLDSVPSGVALTKGKDRKEVGRTPLEIELPVGPYEFTLQHPGYLDSEFSAQLTTKEPAKISKTLNRHPAITGFLRPRTITGPDTTHSFPFRNDENSPISSDRIGSLFSPKIVVGPEEIRLTFSGRYDCKSRPGKMFIKTGLTHHWSTYSYELWLDTKKAETALEALLGGKVGELSKEHPTIDEFDVVHSEVTDEGNLKLFFSDLNRLSFETNFAFPEESEEISYPQKFYSAPAAAMMAGSLHVSPTTGQIIRYEPASLMGFSDGIFDELFQFKDE